MVDSGEERITVENNEWTGSLKISSARSEQVFYNKERYPICLSGFDVLANLLGGLFSNSYSLRLATYLPT